VYWLLAVTIPGLLILAAVGLERLETVLYPEAVTAAGIAERAEPDDGAAPDDALEHRRLEHAGNRPEWDTPADPFPVPEPARPPRRYPHPHANPQFHGTRNVNPV
jgi:hypothetical protein